MFGADPRKSPYRSNGSRKPFQPAVGSDFGRVDEVEAQTRGFLARTIAMAAIVGVTASGAYGFLTGNTTPVVTVWAIVGPIIGAVVSHYFGPHRSETR
jgi:hypothetical protein